MRTRYYSRGKFLTENTRTQWTWCPHLWVHKWINRSGVTRAIWNKSSFGTSTLSWAGERWRENLQRNKVVALGGVRGCICRQVLSMIMWLWKPEGKKKYMHTCEEASILLTAFPNALGRLQFKAPVELEGAWLQCPVAAGPIQLSELSLPQHPWLTHHHQEGPALILVTPGLHSCWGFLNGWKEDEIYGIS